MLLSTHRLAHISLEVLFAARVHGHLMLGGAVVDVSPLPGWLCISQSQDRLIFGSAALASDF